MDESTLTSRRGHMVLERRVLQARDGLLALAQTFTCSDTRTLVTHRAFVLARVEVLEGSLSFPLNSGSVEAPSCFLLAVPPRSVLPMTFKSAGVRSEGVAGFSSRITDVPAMLACDGDAAPLDLKDVERALCRPVLARLDQDAAVGPAIVQGADFFMT